MKLPSLLLAFLLVGVVVCDPKGKKKSKKALLFAKLTKPFYKLPLLSLLGSTTTTTPSPSHVKCDVIWEEKVTPLCKTKHHKICEPEWKEHCHKVWDNECWDEPVEKCHSVQECHTETQNVCKTEYTIECEDPHDAHHGYENEHGHHKRSVDDADGSMEVVEVQKRSPHDHAESDSVAADEAFLLAHSDAHSRMARSVKEKKVKAKLIPKKLFAIGAGLLGASTTTTSTAAPTKETLCHHHPHTKCWDEPVEACHAVPECHVEQEQRCKKVPREVCQQVEKERCWDEPEEHCEYMRVKVAKKHCRKPKQW